MTKIYHFFNKPDASSSMNVDEQNIFLKTDAHKIPDTIKPPDDKFRERSQKLLTKLRQIKINPISSNQGEQKSNNQRKVSDEKQNKLSVMPKNSLSISESQTVSGSISNAEAKLTGILKTSISLQLDRPRVTSHRTLSNPLLPAKHVTFSDKISKKKYKPDQPVSYIKKVSRRQQRKLKKLQQTDLLNLQSNDQNTSPSVNTTDENSINSLQFQDLISLDSDDDESSDDD